MLFLLYYIYWVMASTLTIDAFIYTSEIMDEGISIDNNKLSIGKKPVLFKLEFTDNNYYIKAKDGKGHYLIINDNKLSFSPTKKPWIFRKNKLVSDITKVNHYQLENSSKCISKDNHVLSATSCNIAKETQLFFLVSPHEKRDRAKIEKFFGNVIDSVVRVTDDKQHGKKKQAVEKEQGDLYQILIERSTVTTTTTVALVDIQAARSELKKAMANKRQTVSKVNRAIREKEKKEMRKSGEKKKTGRKAGEKKKGGKGEKKKAGEKKKGGKGERSSESSPSGKKRGGKGERSSESGPSGEKRGRGEGSSESGEGSGRAKSRKDQSSDYDDMKKSRSDDLMMKDKDLISDVANDVRSGTKMGANNRPDQVGQMLQNIKEGAGGARNGDQPPRNTEKDVILSKEIMTNKRSNVPGDVAAKLAQNMPGLPPAVNEMQRISITVPVQSIVATVPPTNGNPNSPYSQPQQASPYAPPYGGGNNYGNQMGGYPY